MLQFILGRAATGKTTYVRRLLGELMQKGESVYLIVPEQFSYESEKAVIELYGAKKAAEIKILSFTSLAGEMIEKYEPMKKPAVNDSVKSVIMSLALEGVSEELEIFSGCTKNKKTLKELLAVTDELIQCGVSPGDMLSAAEKSGNGALIKKAEELALAAEMYEVLLTDRFSDERYMINAAAKIIAEKKIFNGAYVFFDEFTGFTGQENLIVAEILKQAETVYVTGCAESINDATNGTGPFAYSSGNLRKLKALADKCGVKTGVPIALTGDFHYNSKAIAALESGVYSPLPEIYTADAPEITVAAAANPYEECEFAAVTAKKLVREKGLRYRDIVVIGRNPSYRKYLTFAFKKYGIPVFEDTRRSLENELIVRYASSALSLAAEGFTTDGVLTLLKTYIFGIAEEDIAKLENYLLIWQIDRGGWLDDWSYHPDGYGYKLDEEARGRIDELNALRRRIVFAVKSLGDALTDADGYSAVKAVYDFLINTGADKNLSELALSLPHTTASECARSWDEFMNALSLLADTVGERKLSPVRFCELFKIAVASSDIGDIPTGLDEITVGDADRIRVDGKKVLFAVGANEGVFPMNDTRSFVLTENERRILKNQGLELGDDSMGRMQKERLRVYSALSIPSDMLFASYSLGSFKGESSSPSEIISMIKKIVPRCRKIEVSLLPPEYFVESSVSAFYSAAAHFSDNTSYSESVKAYVYADGDSGDKLRSVERLVRREPFNISDGKISEELFGKNLYVTPSRVEEYRKCAFKYFCRYGIYAKPQKAASFDSVQNGLAVHYVLEHIFAEFGSDGIVGLNEFGRREVIEKYTDEYIRLQMGGKDKLTPRAVYALERCKDTVYEILNRLANEFSSGSFKTRDVELTVGADGQIPPYAVEADGGKVYISGIVDRVDSMELGEESYLRVVDYKTGAKEFRLRDVMSGLNIQMLFYLICLIENGGERYGKTAPAGVLYVPARSSANRLGRYADERQIETERILQGKMNGIILRDEEIIRGMEADGGGLIINASIGKDGKIKGSTFSMRQFGLLHKKIDGIAADMALSLRKGKIQAEPMLDGSYSRTCEYCDYKAVCCREDGDSCQTLFNGDVWEALEEEFGETENGKGGDD